jgi:glyoxylase-like metal-dependent hydrolase (beta-lactamase superfamily II)
VNGEKDVPQETTIISLGGVNCYLVKAGDGYVLIDAGLPNKRADLERALGGVGCKPGSLKLVVLTHGDYDHAGNCAYLREKYGTRIAMHSADAGRVERGDWRWGFKAKPDRFSMLFRVVSFFIRPGEFDTFKPDVYVEDGQDLSEYGLGAEILHLPGHTRGSIGVLTAEGDLFCGDLLDSVRGRPELQFFIDDLAAANASLEKLQSLTVRTIYPGHGKPFPMEAMSRVRAGRRA